MKEHHGISKQYSCRGNSVQPISVNEDIAKKLALIKLRLYRLILYKKGFEGAGTCFELKDGEVIINAGTFLRWRLTTSELFWGTSHGLDDDFTGIFRLPINILKPLAPNVAREQLEAYAGLYNFFGGGRIINDTSSNYWTDRNVGLPATPGSDGMRKGTKGIYFDFVPTQDERRIKLFVLFDKDNLKYSSEKAQRIPRNIIDIWECDKGCDDKPVKSGSFDGSDLLYDLEKLKRIPEEKINLLSEKKRGWIDTDMRDPFYVFARKDDHYFVTVFGMIYVARQPSCDSRIIDRLISDLNSDAFWIRDRARAIASNFP